MIPSTDQALRDKLKKASIEELMDNYDEAAIWQEIQKSNQKRPSSILLFGQQYWRYAAILILGLLLGFYFDKDTGLEQLIAQRVILRQAKKDTVFVVNATIQKPENNSPTSIQKATQTQGKFQKVEESQASTQQSWALESVVEPPSPLQENPIPSEAKKEIAVLYLEDLQSAKEIDNHMAVKKKRRAFIELNKSNEGERASQELPIRNLLFASNH